MNRKHSITLIASCVIAASLWGAASPRIDATKEDLQRFSIILPEDIIADSLLSWELQNIVSDTLTERASQLYRQIIQAKIDGISKDELYQLVYQAFEESSNALAYSEPQSSNWSKARNQLLGLDGDLERGAYYYSSVNQQDNMGKYAQAFIDIQLMDEFKNHPFTRDEQSFPLITYIAASRAYNTQDFEKAITYFKLYFSTGAMDRRQQVYLFMGQACLNAKKYDLAVSSMREAMRNYPQEKQFMMIGMQACQQGGLCENLSEFLDPALALAPDDQKLLRLKGKLQEDDNEYMAAIATYTRLDELSPMNLDVNKHLALCYYNYAVYCFNDALNEPDEKKARRLRDKANTYFSAASQSLENVLGSDPMAVKYLKALGVSYLCLGEKGRFDSVNQQLAALGEDALSDAFVPPLITPTDGTQLKYTGQRNEVIPDFVNYATEYVKPRMEKWVEKNEFESVSEYTARVNDATILSQAKALEIEAQTQYLETYSSQLELTNMKLDPYDTTNQTFRIESSYGPVTLQVPIANHEAEYFKANWAGMRFYNPKYYIVNNKPQIGSLEVKAPNGTVYKYDNSQELSYAQTNITINWTDILDDISGNQALQSGNVATNDVTIKAQSDVDRDIPTTKKVSSNTYALVIANENYENVSKVRYATNDGELFAEYCNLTLGLPKDNVKLLKNATFGQINGAIQMLKNIVNSLDGNADVIVYYAGHGIPDESNRSAYLMPTDAYPTLLNTCYSLDKLYDDLDNLNSHSTMVFMDACFSGASRDSKPLVEGRGVVLEPKPSAAKGNMFVLTATSGSETALPYHDKNHGMFTYFLLKKLQESKGNVTLKDLSEYVVSQVKQYSISKNQKLQTPTIRKSGAIGENWASIKMLP